VIDCSATVSCPTVSAANITTNSLDLSWSDVAEAWQYRIWQNGVAIDTVSSASARTRNVNGLAANTTYDFMVEAADASGSWSPSCATYQATTGAVLSCPSGMSITDITTNSLNLSWNDVGARQYRIWQGGSQIGTVGQGVLSWPVTGLAPSTTYNFKVEAGDGNGSWSSGCSAYPGTTKAINNCPTWPGPTLTASSPTCTGLTLNWSAAADDKGIAYYLLYKGSNLIGKTSGLTYPVSGLASASTYTFQVKAVDTDGCETPGPSTTASTQTDCQPPQDNKAWAGTVTCNSIDLLWRAAKDDVKVTKYRIYQDSNPTPIYEGAASLLKYQVTGMADSTSYNFRIQAGDAAGNWSSGAAVTERTDDCTPPTCPVVTFEKVASSSVDLAWSGATDKVGVTGYKILRRLYRASGPPDTWKSSSTSGEKYHDYGLNDASTYEYLVKAGDAANNWSEGCSIKSVTTTDGTRPWWTGGTLSFACDRLLTLSWSGATDNVAVTRYQIFKDKESLPLAELPAGDNRYELDIAPYTEGSTFSFRVEAGDAANSWSIAGPQETFRKEGGGCVTDIRRVVAFYRNAYKSWLYMLDHERVTSQAHRHWGIYENESLVRQAADQVGWDTLLDYVWDNVGSSKRGVVKEQAVRSAAADSDLGLGESDGVILIDISKTGREAIVGVVPIENSYQSVINYIFNAGDVNESAKSTPRDRFDIGTQTYKLQGGQTVKVDLQGYSYTVSPLLLDLLGLGKPDLLAGPNWRLQPGRQLATTALRHFDLDGSGKATWEWVGPKSGLLVWDPEHFGRINSAKQLFGNHTWEQEWKDGYEPLATLDSNQDGQLTGDELSKLAVWQDRNSNASSEPGEVMPVTKLGIEAIAVRPEHDQIGNTWATKGFVRRMPDGKRRTFATWDWISMGNAKSDKLAANKAKVNKPDQASSSTGVKLASNTTAKTSSGSYGVYVWLGQADPEMGIAKKEGFLERITKLAPWASNKNEKKKQKELGGYLRLEDYDGVIKGLSFPTIGNVPPDNGLIVALPLTGQIKDGSATWRGPAPKGSSVESKVTVVEGGKHLLGQTTVTTPAGQWSYHWQAELVSGKPLGQKNRVSHHVPGAQ
ncbi:MAG: fibronectin type III domain-containing protein, partial [Cyanobacteria bacterium NC_groundwater_1444_Ag_S-0.65um_54_12]|nr:fibronectin type III domain-containing protein [Cyanobacteria bacterium NC_groundwater_1444_Ag_S-0.65um_54_12]